MEFIDWLGESKIPFTIVFTKLDKLKPAVAEKNLEAIKNRLLETWEELPIIFETSSVSKAGRDGLLSFVEKSYKEYK